MYVDPVQHVTVVLLSAWLFIQV